MNSVEGQGQFCKRLKQTKYKPGQANCRSRGGGWRRVKEAMLSHWAQRPAPGETGSHVVGRGASEKE